MKVAFIHTSKIIKGDKNIYYSNGLKYNVWKRYLKVFDEVIVCTREKKATDINIEKCTLSSGDNIVFQLCSEYNNVFDLIFRNRKIINHIKKVIDGVDACIIRVPSVLGYLAVLECKRCSKPYLIEVVGCPWDAYWNYSISGKVLAPIMTLIMKKCVKYATHSIYVTDKFLQQRYPTTGKSISCSDVELTTMDKSILEKRLQCKKNNKCIKIATTAAVDVRYKGQEYVIEAIAELKKKGYECIYYLAGAGSQDYLKTIAKKYNIEDLVIFLGGIPHDKVFELLDNIDIYIQPSKQEGLPRAVIEAMSRGCPIIGSRTGGIPELCNSKYVFENGKSKQIVEMVIDIQEHMESESIRSFNMAKNYQKEILEQRRTEFLQEFKEYIGVKNDKY